MKVEIKQVEVSTKYPYVAVSNEYPEDEMFVTLFIAHDHGLALLNGVFFDDIDESAYHPFEGEVTLSND